MEVDVPSLVKYVMREAYSEENEGLEMLGITVRFYRDLRTKLREEITKVKKLADAVSGEDGPLSETIRKKRFRPVTTKPRFVPSTGFSPMPTKMPMI